jgi:hypothetical protein
MHKISNDREQGTKKVRTGNGVQNKSGQGTVYREMSSNAISTQTKS